MTNIKLENLEIGGYHLYQDKNSFNFGIDAVLLANFVLRESFIGGAIQTVTVAKNPFPHSAKNKTTLKICDLCSGTLPIPLIIYAKSNLITELQKVNANLISKSLSHNLTIDAFEIDENQVELSNKSIIWNKENVLDAKNIDDDIKIFNDDIKNIILNKEKYKNLYESYDIVTVNPPYNKKGSGITNLDDKKTAARHEISITFDEICKVANLILKSNKKFYFIHQTNRFTEIIGTLKKYSFAAKKICFIHPYIDKPSNLFLVEAVKGGNEGVKVLSPIIIYNKDMTYTDEVLKIYGK